mmetsp:Transcript_90395/g.239178  ORF Transcript_90395/g.239178 Transcript_90395/m.239178 type:complete len:244 (+) Transcript_90395:110-841(+)
MTLSKQLQRQPRVVSQMTACLSKALVDRSRLLTHSRSNIAIPPGFEQSSPRPPGSDHKPRSTRHSVSLRFPAHPWLSSRGSRGWSLGGETLHFLEDRADAFLLRLVVLAQSFQQSRHALVLGSLLHALWPHCAHQRRQAVLLRLLVRAPERRHHGSHAVRLGFGLAVFGRARPHHSRQDFLLRLRVRVRGCVQGQQALLLSLAVVCDRYHQRLQDILLGRAILLERSEECTHAVVLGLLVRVL